MKNFRDFIITTTNSLEGYEVSNYLGVVSAHIVTGTGFFSDFAASFSDVFGGRSNSYEKQLNSIKQEVMSRLKAEAVSRNANAILGMRVDFDEISGKGKTMFMVTAVGTAVKIVSNRQDKSPVDTEIAEELVSAEQIKTIMTKNEFIDGANNRILCLGNESNWKTIIELNIVELIPFILEESQKIKTGTAVGFNDPYTKDNATSIFKKYSSIFVSQLPRVAAIDFLYQMIENSEFADFAIDLIKENELVDYSKILEFLESDNFSIKKKALKILLFDKPSYSMADKVLIEEIVYKLNGAFPELGSRYDKKAMLSSKVQNVWKCNCGKSSSNEGEYCYACGKDINGFAGTDTKPDEVKEYLQSKRSIIENLLEYQLSNE